MPTKRNAAISETRVMGISGERRSKRRYPISLPVQFKIMKNYLVIGTGSGTSLDLSSGGISFATSSPLKVGSYLELSVSWPVLLNQSCPLQLVASGRVVRSDGHCTAIAMDRHEFRTQGARAQAQNAGIPSAFLLAFR